MPLRFSKLRKVGFWKKLWVLLLFNCGSPGDKLLTCSKSHFLLGSSVRVRRHSWPQTAKDDLLLAST